MRNPKFPTTTVSVCVTPEEAGSIRDAAALEALTVSAWATTYTVRALTSTEAQRVVADAVARIRKAPIVRGSRTHRVSMIMRVSDHDTLREAARGLAVTVHAFVQAALIDAAEAQLQETPAPQRRQAERVRRADRTMGSFLVSLPQSMVGIDAEGLSDVTRQLVQATSQQIMAGNGPAIAAGVQKLVASRESERHLTVKLYVPEFDVRAVAHVLRVPPSTLATALAIKAANRIGAEAS